MLLFKLTFAKIISFLTLKDFYIDCCNSLPVLVKSKSFNCNSALVIYSIFKISE